MTFLNTLLILSSILNVFSLSVSDQEYLDLCASHWTTFTPEQQYAWQLYADRLGNGLTGYEAFCEYNINTGKPNRPSPEPPSE